MSMNFSSQIQSKRKQFRNQIRRNQLDDYRRRKRQQLFGYSSSGLKKKTPRTKNYMMLQVPQQFQDLFSDSPFPFNIQFLPILVGEFENTLKENNFSLQVMHQTLSKLVQRDLTELANTNKFNDQVLFSVTRILKTIMTKLRDIPMVSILRTNKRELIEQIYCHVFYAFKNLLKGIIDQQQYQEQQLQIYENRLRLYRNLKNGQLIEMGQSKHQETIENMFKLIQYAPKFKHPLQCCIQEVSQLVESFFNIFQDAESSAKCHVSQLETQKTQFTAKYLKYFTTLSYMMSMMRSSLFTPRLFQFFQGQLNTFQEFDSDMIGIVINTLSNFIYNESDFDKKGDRVIRYDDQLLNASFGVFEACLRQFDLDSFVLTTIAKTMSHAVIMRKILCKLVLRSTIFSNCLEIVRVSQNNLIQLASEHVKKKTPHSVFQKEAEKINLMSHERLEIYSFLGMLFSSIELNDLQTIDNVIPYVRDLIEIIYFEYSKIMTSEIKDKALIAAIELQPMEQKEKIVHTVLYLQFNLFSFSPEIIEKFIEKNVLMYFIGIWQHFSQAEESLLKHYVVFETENRLKFIKRIQYSIISAIWNTLVQFRFPDSDEQTDSVDFKNRSESLQVIMEFKQFGIMKLLLIYLKSAVYDTDSVKVDKESVKFALLSLIRFFKFILYSSEQRYFCECLISSSTPISTVKEVLSRIMNSEELFEQLLTAQALKSLQLLDMITNNANYNDEQEYYEQEYREQQYEGSQRQESGGNWNGNNGDNRNWQNNQGNWQNNQGNWQNNQGNWQNNQGNWQNNNNSHNYQQWNQNSSGDVEI